MNTFIFGCASNHEIGMWRMKVIKLEIIIIGHICVDDYFNILVVAIQNAIHLSHELATFYYLHIWMILYIIWRHFSVVTIFVFMEKIKCSRQAEFKYLLSVLHYLYKYFDETINQN